MSVVQKSANLPQLDPQYLPGPDLQEGLKKRWMGLSWSAWHQGGLTADWMSSLGFKGISRSYWLVSGGGGRERGGSRRYSRHYLQRKVLWKGMCSARRDEKLATRLEYVLEENNLFPYCLSLQNSLSALPRVHIPSPRQPANTAACWEAVLWKAAVT